MAVQLNHLSAWNKLKSGEWIEVGGTVARQIVFEVNCQSETTFRLAYAKDLVKSKGDESPLSSVLLCSVARGRETIRVTASGTVYLIAESEGEVWFLSPKGNNHRASRPEAVSFTRPAGRRARNPELDHFMRMLQMRQWQNDQIRDAQIAELQAALGAATVDRETGEIVENVNNQTTAGGATTTTVEEPDGGGAGGVQTPASGEPEPANPNPGTPPA